MAIDDNAAAREAVLARVRAALGRHGSDADARAAAQTYIAEGRQGPRPSLAGDLVQRFLGRAGDMASTVERVAALGDAPRAVARYLATLDFPVLADARNAPPAREHADAADEARLESLPSDRSEAVVVDVAPAAKSTAGVCWPEFATLPWGQAGLTLESRPTTGHDALGVTGCFCAIAETGTLVFLTGTETPTATFLLPETHVAIVRADQVVAGMEEAFARVRRERPEWPRAVNLVSGPSRTGDIEQTIVLGAHGPRRLHIVLVGQD
jgi:L-lactate dehydrogenase complex protein LldG